MNFYELPETVEGSIKLKQGDIISPVPFSVFSVTEARIILPGTKEPVEMDLTEQTSLPEETRLVTNVEASFGIVLNQTCDLAAEARNQKPILVAKVVPAEKLIKEFKASDTKRVVEQIKNLRNSGKHPTIFYLPEYQGANFYMPKSIVSILQVVCFPPSNRDAIATLIKLRLTHSARQAFQERLAYCFGRFAAADDLYFNEQEWEREKPTNN